MINIFLGQKEADDLIKLEKHSDRSVSTDNGNAVDLPDLGGKISVPLICINQREKFSLDLSRSKIILTKKTNQLRYYQVICLVRLDIGGPSHRNPDDNEVPSPHLHIYQEGYGDKWAYAVPENLFQNLDNYWETLLDFMKYCSITKPPRFQKGLYT
jgi:hypothetical protein